MGVFGFPEFYGRNMNAWIDCLSSIDLPDDGMTNVHCEAGDTVTINLEYSESLKQRCPDQHDAIVECTSAVNLRRIEIGEAAVLVLVYHVAETHCYAIVEKLTFR